MPFRYVLKDKNMNKQTDMASVEKVKHLEDIIAIIIRNDHADSGIKFFTPQEFSQQLAYMKRPAGYRIMPHVHKKVWRNVIHTQEVLWVKNGRVKVDLYTVDKTHLSSIILEAGDVILLASGGHGLTMLEESEIIEVKQGPYAGAEDKETFEPSHDSCK